MRSLSVDASTGSKPSRIGRIRSVWAVWSVVLAASLLLGDFGAHGGRIPDVAASAADVTLYRYDLTGDGVVAHADIMEVVMAWTTSRQQGDPCGDEYRHADIDGDGCVTISDIQAVSAHVGNVVSFPKNGPHGFTAPSAMASGSTFVVNSTGDQPDANPGDGICRTAQNTCTLRAAIVEANLEPGPNTIAFNIAGAGPHSINISTPLPTLSDTTGPTTIDGYTQPGSSPNTHALASNAVIKIEIVGPRALGNQTSVNGLMITSPGNRVQGLAFLRLGRSIWLSGANARDNVIVGTFVGTGADGQPWYDAITDVEMRGGDPGAFGIWFSHGANNNRIGGSDPADRNVISGNANDGIGMRNEGTSFNVIIGNLIGLAPSGLTRLVNWGDGLDFNYGASSNRIGGTGPGERNVISGNRGEGIELSHDPATALNRVIGNYIGTDITGNHSSTMIRNTGYAISLEDGVANNDIGPGNVMAFNGKGGIEIYGQFNAGNRIFENLIGVTPNGTALPNNGPGIRIRYHATRQTIGPSNVIANNQGSGVLIIDSTVRYNTITRNSMFANTGLGIDIDPVGVNENDQYSKSGANDRLNFPVITTATTSTVAGTACGGCTVEVFKADSAAGQHGEGRTFLGSTTASGSGAFSVSVTGLGSGDVVTSTATDSLGNTSEFSRNVAVEGSGDPPPPPPPPPPGIVLPGTFEAEDYRAGGQGVGYHDTTPGNTGNSYRSDDVDIQPCTDAASTPTCHNVGWIDTGEWLAYDVSVPETGTYAFRLRVATPSTGRAMHVELNGVNITGSIILPNTGGWQSWAYVESPPVEIAAGHYTLKLVAENAGMNWNYVTVVERDAQPPPPPPPADIQLPGTFEVEDYRSGGQGVGYHDTTPGNTGGAYRQDDVDIQTCSDSASGIPCHNVGWVDAGEWLAYNVSFATAGTYTFTMRISTPGNDRRFHVELNGVNVTGSVVAPNTGGWQSWSSVTSQPVHVEAGNYTLKIVAENAGMNFNFMTVSDASGPSHHLPGRIEVEDYRAGGPGVGFHDTTPGNTGGVYRQDDVDIQACTDSASGSPCYNIGWTDTGEWVAFDVSFSESRQYVFNLRVASPGNGRSYRVELNGTNVTGTVPIPNTGGWQAWTNAPSAPVHVAAGQYTLKIVVETPGFNMNFLTVSPG